MYVCIYVFLIKSHALCFDQLFTLKLTLISIFINSFPHNPVFNPSNLSGCKPRGVIPAWSQALCGRRADDGTYTCGIRRPAGYAAGWRRMSDVCDGHAVATAVTAAGLCSVMSKPML